MVLLLALNRGRLRPEQLRHAHVISPTVGNVEYRDDAPGSTRASLRCPYNNVSILPTTWLSDGSDMRNVASRRPVARSPRFEAQEPGPSRILENGQSICF